MLRKNEKNFVLCLLELARRAARFGMHAPTLVQMEEEIEEELRQEMDLPPTDTPLPQPPRKPRDLHNLDQMVQTSRGWEQNGDGARDGAGAEDEAEAGDEDGARAGDEGGVRDGDGDGDGFGHLRTFWRSPSEDPSLLPVGPAPGEPLYLPRPVSHDQDF